MDYEEVWKTVADLITEFRRKGETIPPEVMEDLRAAKTMIQVFRADPSHVENIPTIENYLGNVESYLISTGQKKFGSKFGNTWMQKLKQAREKAPEEGEAKAASRFVPGLPRVKNWLRVQISNETPEKEIKKLAGECGLLSKTQSDGYLLVYGSEEGVKSFVQRMSKRQKVSRN